MTIFLPIIFGTPSGRPVTVVVTDSSTANCNNTYSTDGTNLTYSSKAGRLAPLFHETMTVPVPVLYSS